MGAQQGPIPLLSHSTSTSPSCWWWYDLPTWSLPWQWSKLTTWWYSNPPTLLQRSPCPPQHHLLSCLCSQTKSQRKDETSTGVFYFPNIDYNHICSAHPMRDIIQEQASDDDEETFFDSETLPTPFGVVRPGQLTSPSSSCCPSDRESLAGDYSDREEEGWGGGRTPTFHPPHSPYYCPPSDGDITPTR